MKPTTQILFRAWAIVNNLFFHIGNLAYDAIRLAFATVVKCLTKFLLLESAG